MIYKGFQDLKLSALGFGTMRMPTLEGDNSKVDIPQLEQMVKLAFDAGVNYFDTAWAYHGGQSEVAIGQVLHSYPRDSFYLATKFPGYDVSIMAKVEEVFETQLKKCQVDYFDFYLFHNVCERNIEGYLDPKFGILDYLLAQKKAGRIRHLGFSCHGSMAVLKRFLDAYGQHLEFCQLQINWLDWEFQNAREKCALLEEYNIPVWVMEPLRGGRLCQLDSAHEAQLKALRPEESIPGWCFRFLQSLPHIGMILSGMSNLQQMAENTATFQTEQPLTSEEMEVLLAIGQAKIASSKLPCTGCRYCVDHCPQALDIPKLLELYNAKAFPDAQSPATAEAVDKGPEHCIGCRSCEQVCPQGIKISQIMEKLTKLA